MSFAALDCKGFTDILSSKAAVPGGGGASALVGAVGVALGSMVCNLTAGKKKYAAVEDDIRAILVKAADIRERLISMIDKDAEVFEPLSKAYSIPKDDPSREEIMENALRLACTVPMDIMRACCEAIELHAFLADNGSSLALSDVGVGVACCSSALKGASLNIFINTKSMTDRAYAEALEREADEMLSKYTAMADAIYNSVFAALRREEQ